MKKIFNSPEELVKRVEEYFIYVKKENEKRKKTDDKLKPLTISGICVYLAISKDTWCEYAKREGYTEPIKEIKSRIENFVEEGILNGSINTVGGIFNLKNNFSWTDRQEIISQNTNTNVELTSDDAKKYLEELSKKVSKE